MNIRVERRRDRDSGEYFEMVGGLKFKDGFLYKSVSAKSITTQSATPTLNDLEKFHGGDNIHSLEEDIDSLMLASSKKGGCQRRRQFVKGDAVIVIRGDVRNLTGWVEKVEEEIVHVRPNNNMMPGLPKTLVFKEKDLCKHFKLGDRVRVVSGVQQGATGSVVKVEGRVLIINSSDTTSILREDIRVFTENVVEMSSSSDQIATRIGDYYYELHDLVLLDDMSFGMIISAESEAVGVLKAVPDQQSRPCVVTVKLRGIKSKIERKRDAQDRFNNRVSVKDVVKVVEGPCKGGQGTVEHIHRGVVFIRDRHRVEHSGFICAKAQSCVLVGGSLGKRHGGGLNSKLVHVRAPAHVPRDRGGRGHDSTIIGRPIKMCAGPWKGYRGRVTEVKGINLVRVELDSQMKIVTVKRDDITDAASFSSCYYGNGSETPMRSYHRTPMRDGGATPSSSPIIHDGMRTPMPGRAWAPVSPMRDAASWGSSPQYQQPSTPLARPYEYEAPATPIHM